MTVPDVFSLEDLRALTEAGLSLTSELSLDVVLQRLVDLARGQSGARYGAMSVLGPNGEVEQFVTSGITEEQRRQIGEIPRGHGLLGVLLHEGSSLRLTDMARDPRSAGFPPRHPPMTSLLGVPVVMGDRIIGNLYLTDKIGANAFSDRDEELVRLLATQAAVAVRNAELYQKLESLTRLEERERIGMDLHDGVIQSIYAVALQLEDCMESVPDGAAAAKPQLEKAIDDLNKVIKDIRSYIFDLRPRMSQVSDLPDAIAQLVEDTRVNTLLNLETDIERPLDVTPSEAQALALFHIAQEALNNVAKHSRASLASVRLATCAGRVTLEVHDNGIGFGATEDASGERHGLRNMRDRARSVGATFACKSEPGVGTKINVDVPVRRRE